MVEETGKKVLYVMLQKALYRTLQAALLFWENLSMFLIKELGFMVNPYDRCVVNKVREGKQCTIIWHIDDLKLSHVWQSVLEDISEKLNVKYRQKVPLMIHHGELHEYIGMTIGYSEEGKVKFIMEDYIDGILGESPEDMRGDAVTPAALNLFTVHEEAEKLDDNCAEMYHHLMAKLLFLCKRARPNLQTTVSFLTTRVTGPDEDDWKKLA